MNIDKLTHAVAVAREGSFSSAAAVIPMSQSALTRSIQSLERTYGVTLFVRQKNGVSLTPAGVDFIAAAETFLRNAKRVDEQLISISSGHDAAVRFGAGPVMTAKILPDILARLADQGAHFEVRTGSNASLRSLLSRNEIDFFFGGAPHSSDNFNRSSGFNFEPILTTRVNPIRLVMRAGHPLAYGPLSNDRLAEFPTACDSFTKEMLGPRASEKLGLPPPRVEIDDYHVLARLTCLTDFVTIARWDVERLRPLGLVGRPLAAEPLAETWSWGFVSPQRSPLAATALSVIDVIRQSIEDEATARSGLSRVVPMRASIAL